MITRWVNINSIEYVIASTYAQGKGYIFEMLFGWRKTRGEDAKFVFCKKDWENIDTMIKYYNTFVKKTF